MGARFGVRGAGTRARHHVVGYFMARRVAAVRDIDIPLAGLPAALEGFTIAQITDIHVGPTIKRAYVQRIVDRVNRLGADVVAITGDLVDGSVADLARTPRRSRSSHRATAPTSSPATTSTTRARTPGSASCAASAPACC
jgi:predicted MPP superfamily phosphohydrolase